MQISPENDVTAYIIYIGINDKNTHEQIIDTAVFERIIKNVCKGYSVAFSTHLQQGGYLHENGVYTQENSAVLTLIGASREDVNAVAADLCCFFNQESVLVEVRKSACYSVSETIAIDDLR